VAIEARTAQDLFDFGRGCDGLYRRRVFAIGWNKLDRENQDDQTEEKPSGIHKSKFNALKSSGPSSWKR
jgi:hypothetical protein